MSSAKVVTNNVPRDIIHGYELSAKERAEFDYYTSDELDGRQFFRYRGMVYDLAEFYAFRPGSDPPPNWDGFQTDSYFSATLVRYVENHTRVIVGVMYT